MKLGRTRDANFNPRSPRGERQCRRGSTTRTRYFNPRSPRGERRSPPLQRPHTARISIHAPREGSDPTIIHSCAVRADFNPRSPRGERRLARFSAMPCNSISIHAPREGSDCTVKAYSNDRIKRSTLREPHFLYSKNACFSPIFPLCATTSRTKNQRIIVSFGSYPGLAPMCFTLDWYRFPRL